jgi:hypothetical protein
MASIQSVFDNAKRLFACCAPDTPRSSPSETLRTPSSLLRSAYSGPLPLRVAQLESLKSEFDPLIYRRALHCVTEDLRTLAAVEALKTNTFATVGELMTQSHRSLQHDYEVHNFLPPALSLTHTLACTHPSPGEL